MRLESLRALRDAVKAGGATIGAMEPLAIAAFPDDAGSRAPAFMHVWSAYRGSLDAAHALHKAVLPGWVVENLGNACIDGTGGWTVRIVAPDYLETFSHGVGKADTPARAWLLAIISALVAQETTP